MRRHPLTWCTVLVVLGCFGLMNLQPIAEAEGLGILYGRPLVYKERAIWYTTLKIHPDRPFGAPNYHVTTRLNHSALLMNVLLAALSAAAAGILSERLLHRQKLPGVETSGPSR